MADEPTPDKTVAHDALSHMAEELEELEHDKPNWGRWVIGIVLLGGLVAAILWLRGPDTQKAVEVSGEGVRIEMREPAAVKLSQPPSQFRWESVAGRHHYLLVITAEKGGMAPIEKNVKSNVATLTTTETQALRQGLAYIWRVTAIGDDGRTIGVGAARFEL